MAMRGAVMLGTSSSSFSGRSVAAARISSSPISAAPRAVVVSVEAKKVCQLTGEKRCDNAQLSHSVRPCGISKEPVRLCR